MSWQGVADLLPHVTASLNASTIVVLAFALRAIRAGNARKHKKLMLTALTISAVFLAFYLFHKVALYQATGEPNTRYPSDPEIAPTWSRYTYYGVLGTHLVLAITVPFLAIRAVFLAKKGRILAHKKLVRWAYPIWMYVSVTGVIVYAMLYHHPWLF